MASFEIDVNGVEYRGETAPATDQWEALHICLNSKIVLAIKEGVSDQALVLMVMGAPRDDLKRLEKLLLKNKTPVVRAGDDVPVALSLFQDRPEEYALLLGKVAAENLRGFYSLRTDNASAGSPEQTSEWMTASSGSSGSPV